MDLEFHQLDLRYQALRSQQAGLERRLLNSIHEHGQQVPIVVCEDAGRHVVVDGYKRIRALRTLGMDKVAALAWALAPSSALIVARLMCNSPGDSALEQGWCLARLNEESGLSESELARRFGRSISWVSRRMALVRALSDETQHLVQSGRVGAYAAQKYLVPLARANAAHAHQLAKWMSTAQPCSRLVGQIYAAWLRSSPKAREWLVDNPGLFEAAQTELQRAPDEQSTHAVVLRDVGVLAAMSRRLVLRIAEVPWPAPDHSLLLGKLQDAVRELALVQQAAVEAAHAG